MEAEIITNTTFGIPRDVYSKTYPKALVYLVRPLDYQSLPQVEVPSFASGRLKAICPSNKGENPTQTLNPTP